MSEKDEAKDAPMKVIEVDKMGVFTCPCEDDGAIRRDTSIPLGRFTFFPCLRCMRQIEGLVMTKVVVEGAKLAVEHNFKRQELAGRDPLAFLKNAKVS